ncbi:hypothetical protein ACFYS7_40990 [Streptomyces avermitilis]|uniref:VMAP-C domain-containing protein n=1 Tax=Streptomyces avermitilis TaxID=33903 RepID=UPI0036963A5E
MTTAVDPARTQALVVAIERYEDPAWDVTGPYSDACAFITWLVDSCSVPAENISFYASAHPESLRQADNSHLLPPAVKTKEADSASIARYIQEGMVTLDGELLWVFWSGHGVVDRNGSHVLLLADSSVATKRAIAVDALQLALQSRRVGRDDGLGMPKVAVAVNACQNQPAGVEVVLTDVVTTSTRVTDRGLFVMHACSTGQKARNVRTGAILEGTATGLFPRALLTSLDDGSGSVLPDLHRVSDEIDRVFAELRNDNLTLQKPSLLRRNWDGRTLQTGEFALAPTERDHALAALLDTALPDMADRTACAKRLAARIPVMIPISDDADACSTEQLVTAAGRVMHGIPTLMDALLGAGSAGDGSPTGCPQDRVPLTTPEMASALHEAARRVRPDEFLTHEEYSALVRILGAASTSDMTVTARLDRKLRPHLPAGPADLGTLVRALEAVGVPSEADTLPTLLRFVCLAAAEADACGGDASALRAWARQVANRIGSPADTLATHMQAAIEGCVRRRTEKTWLMVRLEVNEPETGTCRYAFSAWVIDSVSGVANLGGPRGFLSWREVQYRLSTVVEPYLANDRINLGVEFFLPVGAMELQVERIPVSYRDVDNVPLGTVVPVVVRCAQRRATWSARWDACGTDTAAGDHHWLRHDALDLPRLHAALQARPLIGCVELTGPHAEFTPALAYCAQAGVPVMAWHRRLGERRAVRDLAQLRQVVHPRDLPEELRQLRAGAGGPSDCGGGDLVLLWDDPHRLPPRLRLRSPGRTPRP